MAQPGVYEMSVSTSFERDGGNKSRSYIVVGATESTLLVCMLDSDNLDLVIPDAGAVGRRWGVNLAQGCVY